MNPEYSADRHVVVTLCLAVLMLTAGCDVGGGGGGGGNGPTPTAGDRGDGPTPTAGDRGGAAEGAAGTPRGATGEATGSAASTFSAVVGNQTAALQETGSFTLQIVQRTGNATSTVAVNLTGRVNLDTKNAYVIRRQQVTGSTNLTLVTELYRTGETVYVRSPLPGTNTTVYERRSLSEGANRTTGTETSTRLQPAELAARYNFTHERTGDGDHRFTVTSPAQVNTTGVTGTVRDISLTIIVDDESGLITLMEYRVEATTERGRVTVYRTYTLTGLGETTVSSPDWLDEAKNRTSDAG